MSEVPFAGFPAGAQETPIPSAFFTRLLPRLTDPVELGLALHVFYLLHRKKGDTRFFTRDELAAEGDLALFLERASGHNQGGRRAAMERALGALVRIGLLLDVRVEGQRGVEHIYFLNAAEDRREADRFRRGELKVAPWRPLPEAEPVEPLRSIYTLYVENIGQLTEGVANELREAEELYPREWLRPAFERAVASNVRKWSYVVAILKRWKAEGPDYAQAGRDTERGARRPGQFSGKYQRLVRR